MSGVAGRGRGLADLLDSSAMRTRILRGAALAFSDNGVRDCSVEQILRAAGVSRRTFYQSFRSRDDVLMSLFEFAIGVTLDAVRAAGAADDPPPDRLRAGIRAYMAVQRLGAPLGAVLQAEAIRPESPLADKRREVIDEFARLLAAGMDAAAGDIDPLLFRALVVAAEGLMIEALAVDGFDDARAARLEGLLVALFSRALFATDGVPPLPRTQA